MNPIHPIYIVSKGRWRRPLTARSLTRMGVPFWIVVEPDEVDAYASAGEWIRPDQILPLDMTYKRDYDTCDDLGDTKGKGPGGARNFAWDHAIQSGASWHWVMDDNIDGFFRLNHNLKTPVADGTILRVMEDFCARYENVLMGGPNYFMFAPSKNRHMPFALNTRIYSCNLIRNDAPYRWRGRYNEDTDLSLRMLKDGWVTVQFYAFLQNKMPTQTMKGGNTDEFYASEGTRAKSEMQVALHPDVSRVTHRFGRVHHFVDYYPFHWNALRRREGVVIPDGTDNYGMVLEQRVDGRWIVVEKPDALDGYEAEWDLEALIGETR